MPPFECRHSRTCAAARIHVRRRSHSRTCAATRRSAYTEIYNRNTNQWQNPCKPVYAFSRKDCNAPCWRAAPQASACRFSVANTTFETRHQTPRREHSGCAHRQLKGRKPGKSSKCPQTCPAQRPPLSENNGLAQTKEARHVAKAAIRKLAVKTDTGRTTPSSAPNISPKKREPQTSPMLGAAQEVVS